MTWLQALVLGVVQGLTEFIPVSSTAHLRIVPALLGWPDPGAAFTAVIQLGTLAAALVYFWRDIWNLTAAALRSLVSSAARQDPTARLAWAIVLGNIPIVVLGLAFRDFIEGGARSLVLIATRLIVVALLLAVAEWVAKQTKAAEDLGVMGVFVIGIFQALALAPGASRSGSTILGGLLMGLRREDATRFSFLLGMPAIFGAGLLQLVHLARHGADSGWGALLIALVTSAVVGYWSIGFLIRFLKSHRVSVFVIYRIALGVLLLVLAWRGIIA
ncbi:MAG TPA: undecaprenyl-diphosphatase UppP [bacterium]